MDYTKDAVLIQDIKKTHQLEQEAKISEQLGEDNSTSSAETNTKLVAKVLVEILNNMSNLDDESMENDTDLGYVPYYERPETYIVPVLFVIIFLIGVLGNGTLIAIFLKHRTMRNVPNMYICSLAVGDILVIFFCVPFTSTVYTVESWPYGVVVCKFSEFIKDLSIGISVFTLTALSADRYFAIVDPMRKLTGRRATRITCVTIAGIWILSTIIALPSALFSYVRVIDGEPSHTFQVCYPFPPELGPIYPQVMVMLKFLVYYAVPLMFIASFYIIMAQHLVQSTRNMPGEAQGQAKQIQARKKVAKMVLSFVVIFALCFFPSHVFLLWFYFDPDSENNFNAFWNICRILGFCLGFINSCINPITLYCVSGTFRKQFNQHLFCCICDVDGRARPGRRGLACGCVSISNTGHMYADRNRNGSVRANGLFRASTTNSGPGPRRKPTWETQSTASHNQLLMSNMNTNIHGNPNLRSCLAHSHPITGSHPSVANVVPTNEQTQNNFPLTHHLHQNPNISLKGITDLDLKNATTLPSPIEADIISGGCGMNGALESRNDVLSKSCEKHGGITQRSPLISQNVSPEEYTVTSFIKTVDVESK